MNIVTGPLDGSVFYYYEGKKIAASLLVRFGAKHNLEYYPELYRIDKPLEDVCVITHAMFTRGAGGHSMVKLGRYMYKYGFIHNIKYAYIDCSFDDVDLFLRIGFNIHEESVMHPVHGHGTCMVFDLNDIEYLKKIGSILLH